MRIAVDAHAIGNRQTGNEVYVRNLLQRFVKLEPRNDYLAYVSAKRGGVDIPDRVKTRRVSANPFVRLGFQLGAQLREDRPDLIHVQYTAPLRCPVPIVVTVHDVSFLHHPDFFSPFRQRQLAITVERTVRRAARIVTCSDFSRRRSPRPTAGSETIHVAHNGVAPGFKPVSQRQAKAIVRDRYGISAPFLLCVGTSSAGRISPA